MRVKLKFTRILLLAGCLIFLGLNTAANGLQRMAPEFPSRVMEFARTGSTLTVTALGKEYRCDLRRAVEKTVLPLWRRLETEKERWRQYLLEK